MGYITARPVQVALAHIQRVHAEMAGDIVHCPLNDHHALGATEASEGGIGHRMGFAAVANNTRLPQAIGVVGMKHGAVDDGIGQVRRKATASGHHDVGPPQYTLVVEANVICVEKVVSLARLYHVVVARHPVFNRPPGASGKQGRDTGQRCSLGFLAAEAATHAPYFHLDFMNGEVKDFGHQLLHLGGVLAGGMNKHARVFGRLYQARLSFQVEMLLSANVHLGL